MAAPSPHRQLIDAVAARLRRRSRLRLILTAVLAALAGLELGWLAALWITPAWATLGPVLALIALTLAAIQARRRPAPPPLQAAAFIDASRGGALFESTQATQGRLASALGRAADQAAASLDPRSLVALRPPRGFSLVLAGLAFLGLLLAGAEAPQARKRAARRSGFITFVDGRGVGLAKDEDVLTDEDEAALEVVIPELPTGIEASEETKTKPEPGAAQMTPLIPEKAAGDAPSQGAEGKVEDGEAEADGRGGGKGEGGKSGAGEGAPTDEARPERSPGERSTPSAPGAHVGTAARQAPLSWRARTTLKRYFGESRNPARDD